MFAFSVLPFWISPTSRDSLRASHPVVKALLSIIDGSSGLLTHRRRRSRTPPRLPRLRCGRVLVCVARMAARQCSGGVDWRVVGRRESKDMFTVYKD